MNEEDIVWHYCHKRPLYRPSTNIKTLLVYLVQLIYTSIIINFILFQAIVQLCGNINFLQSCICLCIIIILFKYRKLLILLIELYQHYAPEHIRRKCICMPTCSEYAICCIRKYNFFKAIKKIYNRLTRECVGQIYHIDNP